MDVRNRIPKNEFENGLEMSKKELFSFMFESFKFSQGDPKLQEMFFKLFWQKNPNIVVSEEIMKMVVDQIITTVESNLVSGKHRKVYGKSIVTEAASTEMDSFINQESASKEPEEEIVPKIVTHIKERDEYYASVGRGPHLQKLLSGTMVSNSVYFRPILEKILMYVRTNEESTSMQQNTST
jgi:hypothetical protein